MRVDPASFRGLDLRCHALLGDVALHDVWAIPLEGGGRDRTIHDVRALFFGNRWPSSPAVRGLFALRLALGRVFRWDDARHDPPGESYLHRLTEGHRARSQVPPGTRDGSFRVLYVFANEALSEIRNATVHAFLALALTRRAGGYTVYLAIYVKAVSRLTPLYMALIDPFRRCIVYPALGRHVQQAWLRATAVSAMRRDTALVTGGNSGIGFECARQLARAGWHVIIASRNREASAEAVRRIVRESGDGAASELGLDLGSTASVRRFAADIEARDVPLRVLVCNAGLQVYGRPQRSPDGYELTFAVNHLGHFLLTNLLLARLARNAPARIVIVSSGVHDPKLRTGMPKPAVADFATLAATGGPREGEFDGRLAYVNSKLCNLWFAHELVRRIEAAGLSTDERPLAVNAFEPGLVPGSGLARDYPAVLRFVWDRILPGLARVLTIVIPTINPVQKAGGALTKVVLDPALERVSGKYFPSHTRWREAPSSDASYDVDRARALWEESARMTRLTPAESPLVHG